MSPATRESWRITPMPTSKAALSFEADYSTDDAARIKLGFVPEAMEDKWFIYYEDGWLYFHRSWIGTCIYALRLEETATGMRVVESWVNRDTSEYVHGDLADERNTVNLLIKNFLLHPR